MTIEVDVTNASGERPSIAARRLARLAEGVLRAEGVRDAYLSLTLLSPRAMARLNAERLGHRGATDVIAFPFRSRKTTRGAGAITGDVYVAPAVARANARRFGGSARTELVRLVVHGTLHVLGYDHPTGDGRGSSPMWRRQEELLGELYPIAAAR